MSFASDAKVETRVYGFGCIGSQWLIAGLCDLPQYSFIPSNQHEVTPFLSAAHQQRVWTRPVAAWSSHRNSIFNH